MRTNPSIADPIEAAYYAGMEAGMRRFAWWKDGAEQVGTCGTSFKKAIRDLDTEAGYTCWHPGYHDDNDGVPYCIRCGTARAT